ncbi:IclR family transcriptional regulator [Lactobacillus ultunensis]|uniref:Transcriptional regulator, IclR family, C-terminal domain protein n=1 Tax=Lactobacillus ultunensis DSM 16047 TaxID=525365 RepID=C2ELE0_9LACO|nr:IclR family transcriptional regulator C-terminal domain-containing protein [Lactobacillus ultunensis]EEJ72662.1 transcriptional regulator, IclR family, C-terminal domain protein [Lactobacillus ultunensis DSM 16047]KRL80667.1 IclR family transcriptional regulator [Lactobacillus ultunensis DSM 16047]QQP28211.1 helix-turn-helix domain-containing protein [Lactobacillus ultunensis]
MDDQKYLLSTLVKAKKVINLINQKKQVSLTQVMNDLHLSKTTAFRLLYSLTELNFINRKNNKYYLSNSPVLAMDLQRLNWTVVPMLKPLVEKYNLSAYVGIIFANNIVITQVVPSVKHYQDFDRLGEKMPINTTAMGKCALAFLPKEHQNQILQKKPFLKKTKYTLTDVIDIKHSLHIIRQQGFALDDEEKEINFRCLAVPLMKNGYAVAVLGLSGTMDELKRCNIKRLAKEMGRVSTEIEMNLLN